MWVTGLWWCTLSEALPHLLLGYSDTKVKGAMIFSPFRWLYICFQGCVVLGDSICRCQAPGAGGTENGEPEDGVHLVFNCTITITVIIHVIYFVAPTVSFDMD